MDHNQRAIDFSGTAFAYLEEKKPDNLTEEEEVQFLNNRLEKLLKIIHARIEEKFRDYRSAFRNIDKDFGGFLEFKEFITSFEEMGIRLKLADFKMIFDALDFDSRGQIDFNKFSFLNADRFSLSDLQKRVRLF
jgi:Ca2+-binding EF-hand superfamily protein